MTTLTNSFEGITPSGTTVSTGNSGGISGNAFDVVSIGGGATLASDSAHAAHGSLSAKFVTAGAADNLLEWTSSMGSQAQVWFREYLFFAALPANNFPVWRADHSGGLAGLFFVDTSGILHMQDSGFGTIFNMTNPIPVGQWFRIEGFLIGNASTGQGELKLFTSADSAVPLETKTSAANVNTAGTLDTYRYGVNFAAGITIWMDDVGLSSTGYLGPAVTGIAVTSTPVLLASAPAFSRAGIGGLATVANIGTAAVYLGGGTAVSSSSGLLVAQNATTVPIPLFANDSLYAVAGGTASSVVTVLQTGA
jgi:hypothetical protein